MRFLISYDVPDDSRRRQLAKAIDSYGVRVQWSVFEAVLDAEQFAQLLARMTEILDPKRDSLVVHSVCAACESRALRLGRAGDQPPPCCELGWVV